MISRITAERLNKEQRDRQQGYEELYTPCILEIGKDSQEGLHEMRDAEKPNERFAFKEYVSEPARALRAEIAAKAKGKKAAARQLVLQET